MKRTLVEITKYMSPEYKRKYIRTNEPTDMGRPYTTDHEDPPKEDQIIKWLEQNTLAEIRKPFPENFSSNGYFLQGENGVSCVISPGHDVSSEYEAKNMVYTRNLTIKSQPANKPLPRELTGALESMYFKEVDSFSNKD